MPTCRAPAPRARTKCARRCAMTTRHETGQLLQVLDKLSKLQQHMLAVHAVHECTVRLAGGNERASSRIRLWHRWHPVAPKEADCCQCHPTASHSSSTQPPMSRDRHTITSPPPRAKRTRHHLPATHALPLTSCFWLGGRAARQPPHRRRLQCTHPSNCVAGPAHKCEGVGLGSGAARRARQACWHQCCGGTSFAGGGFTC